MRANHWLFKIGTIFAVVLLLAGCAGAENGDGETGLGVVTSVTVTDTIETSGNLSADRLATLKWETSGVIEKVNVKPGDTVKLNDVLASLRLDSVPSTVVTAPSDLANDQRALQD